MSGNTLLVATIVLSFFYLVNGGLTELKLEEVMLNHELCGQTLQVGRGETIRLLPSSGPACEGEMEAFDCKVTLERSDRFHFDEICVDFSRIQPTGDGSSLLVFDSPLRENPSVKLTNMRYPHKGYMSTVECRKANATITLQFKSACNASVSDFFPSWLYIYVQPENNKLYYLDGTCKHVHRLTSRSEYVTVRSMLWKNTLGEPDVQRCSLKMEPVLLSLGANNFVCPSWNFTAGHPPCSTTVHWQKVLLFRDIAMSGDEAANCERSLDNFDLTRCFEDVYGVVVQVNRNRQGEEKGWIQNPGQQLLSMTAHYKQETKVFKSTIGNYETSWNNDNGSGNTNTATSFAEEMTPIAKFFLGIAAVVAAICCLCSVAKRMSTKHAREDESQASVQQRERFIPEGLAASVQQTGRFVPRRDPYTYEETLAMQQVPRRPRHLHNIVRVQVRRDQNNSSSRDISDLQDNDSSYFGEVGVIDNGTSTPRRDMIAPHPPTRDVNAPPAYEDVAVAPPSAPPPPSYKDLFPTND